MSSTKRKRYYIITQRYPCFDGSRPLSFAIYRGREFLAYSWTLAGAWVALQVIKKTQEAMILTFQPNKLEKGSSQHG